MLGVNPGSARIGQTIAGRYKLESLIGVGGFGAVYKARHVTMGTTVALKILHAEHCAEPTAVKRFELEATRSASLVHPNSIKVFDFGRTETGEFYLAMEHLEGRTLSSLIHREGHVAPDRTVHILAQILRALDEAHLKGIIHRDLKPDNIFLLEIGHEHDFVKVLDYGISKATDASQSGLTAVGQIIGTPVYMSPEQCMGKPLDGRSDLYAIGCIAYHMLAGRPPFLADEGLMYALQHVQEEPVDVRDMAGPDHPIPTGLALWVHKLLAKAPADRYESAHLALDALSSALTGPATWDFTKAGTTQGLVREEPPAARRITDQTRVASADTGLAHAAQPAKKRRSPWGWVLGGAAALALGAAAVAIVSYLQESAPVASGGAATDAWTPDSMPAGAADATQVAQVITAPDAREAVDSALAPDVEPVADSAVADATAEDAVVDAVVADTVVADAVVADTVVADAVVRDTVVRDAVVRDTVVRDAASDAAEPHVIRVMLTSKPSGAKVLSNHRVVGSTPYEVRWTSGGKAPTFELTARGYRAASVTLREKDAPTRHVVLQRLRPDFEPLEDEPHRGP